jgi:CRP-like cAMP-binding protein
MTAETLASAFSSAGLVGQLAFLLLILGVIAPRLDRARAWFAAASFVGLCHAIFWAGSIVGAFWWGLLLAASLIALAHRLFANTRVRFTAEEEKMLAGVLSTLPRNRARHLLDQGFWLSGREGDVLTREDEKVSHLFYLSDGEARVMSHGRQVAVCRSGDLIGEVTVLSGDRASATVILDGPARFWCAPADVLRPYLEAHDDVRRAIETGFTASLRAKLRASNERIAAAQGAPSEPAEA